VVLSSFTRTARLLDGIEPGHKKTIEMTSGDPKEAMPGFVIDKFEESKASLGTYPRIRGSDELRKAISAWIGRRYGLAKDVDFEREVLPLNGSREGLFFATLPAVGRKDFGDRRPVMLLPNPFYQATSAAITARAASRSFNATARRDICPISMRWRVISIFCGARLLSLHASPPRLRRRGICAVRWRWRASTIMLFLDERYSASTPASPNRGLQIGRDTRRFNPSSSTRLRARTRCARLRRRRRRDFLDTLAEIRNLTAPQMPGPIQHASTAVWSEEQHVSVIRQAYRIKFNVCDELLTGRFGYRRPDGGFFLWLDMAELGGGEQATLTIWKRCGVKVIPGVYLAHEDRHGVNPGRDFIRVALVHDAATVREALTRIVKLTA
jgi:aspartate/methionine/tyrosine aminotransferase